VYTVSVECVGYVRQVLPDKKKDKGFVRSSFLKFLYDALRSTTVSHIC
jgi:hypothetical protein